jgi:hypothetical protein
VIAVTLGWHCLISVRASSRAGACATGSGSVIGANLSASDMPPNDLAPLLLLFADGCCLRLAVDTAALLALLLLLVVEPLLSCCTSTLAAVVVSLAASLGSSSSSNYSMLQEHVQQNQHAAKQEEGSAC